PADGVGLAENDRVLVVELIMIRGETCIDHRELFRFRIVQFDLPGTWTRKREILGEFIRPIFAERRLLLRSSNSGRHPNAPVAVHYGAARVGLSFPDFLGSPVRRLRRVAVDERTCRGKFAHRRSVLWSVEYG